MRDCAAAAYTVKSAVRSHTDVDGAIIKPREVRASGVLIYLHLRSSAKVRGYLKSVNVRCRRDGYLLHRRQGRALPSVTVQRQRPNVSVSIETRIQQFFFPTAQSEVAS